jgi:hypothetical protein
MVRPVKVLALAAIGLVAGPAAQAQGQDPGEPPAGPPACSAVVTKASGVMRPPRNAAEVWVECNIAVTRLTLRANRRLATVRRAPVLYGPDAGDRLSCRQTGPLVAACSGNAGKDVRMRVPMRVVGDVCKRPALRLRVRASGGLDCDGRPCPRIALLVAMDAQSQLGCG